MCPYHFSFWLCDSGEQDIMRADGLADALPNFLICDMLGV